MCSFLDLVSAATAATRDSCKGELRLVAVETTDVGVLAGLGEEEVPSVGIAVDVPTLWTTIVNKKNQLVLHKYKQLNQSVKAWDQAKLL